MESKMMNLYEPVDPSELEFELDEGTQQIIVYREVGDKKYLYGIVKTVPELMIRHKFRRGDNE